VIFEAGLKQTFIGRDDLELLAFSADEAGLESFVFEGALGK
jgi:hypothetical protein